MGKDGYALRAELGKMTGRTSVPAIFVGGEFAGGCNDGGLGGIMSLESQGKLKGMRRQLVHMGRLRHPLGWRAAQPLSLLSAALPNARTAYHTAAARLYFGHTQAHIGGCALRPGVLMRPRLSFGRGCRRG